MSNYTIAVAWSGKDALSDSDPAKVISGSDFNTEFTAVQTAVNTKANLNGSASEVFSASTVDLGNWTITENSGVLEFATGGVKKMKLDASGNLTVVGNMTAYGTI
jgi:hypothetical protein